MLTAQMPIELALGELSHCGQSWSDKVTAVSVSAEVLVYTCTTTRYLLHITQMAGWVLPKHDVFAL